jgi:NTE family protein
LGTSRRKLGFVLSGGGARGAFQVGVYERLLVAGDLWKPAVISGTSAGAINAALMAAGKSPAEMLEFWLGLADEAPITTSVPFFRGAVRQLATLALGEIASPRRFPATIEGLLAVCRSRARDVQPHLGNLLALAAQYLLTRRFDLVSGLLGPIDAAALVDTAPLRARLVDALGGEAVAANGSLLAINAVDAHSGRVVRYVNGRTERTTGDDYEVVGAITVDMILASASIPLLFPPVAVATRATRHLWDGGLLVNTPLKPVVDLGADEIVTLLATDGARAHDATLTRFGDVMERTIDILLENSYNLDRKLLLERNRTAAAQNGARPAPSYRKAALYVPIRPGEPLDFSAWLQFERESLMALYELGRRAADRWLADGPTEDCLP